MVPRQRLDIRWSTSAPEALALRLSWLGFEVRPAGVLSFPGATIRIVSAVGPADRLAVTDETGDAPSVRPPHPNGIEDVVAVGLATVDRERFLADLAGGPDKELAHDPHLGAFVIRHGAGGPGPYVLVIEPDTEGRLAATLARSGEGPVALYLTTAGGLEAFVTAAARRGTPVSSIRPGPLGPSVLLLGPAWGPHLLVVDRPSGGTIPT